jgi:hypothetical protein
VTKLRISPDLPLPIEATTEAIGFLGRRGSGKSYAAQKLAEEFHRAGAQFVAMDPVGNWWGLRLAADGVSPGLPIPVFGGLQGDVPIEAAGGKLVADTIVDRGISAVVDVSQLESDADKARFARDFCERFYFRKKSSPSAVFLFLEEAQEFIPQNPQKEETRMLHAFQRLAKLGRNFGIGIGILSQRPQEVHKKVLNLAELLFVFQLTGVHERRAVEAWIGDKGIAGEDLDRELPKLERGRPHAWSPAWLKTSRVVPIAEKWTFDASSTPKVGAERGPVRELSPIDLEKLRSDMAATIERAKADDPKELRKEIGTLRAEVARLQRAGVVPQTSPKAAVDREEVQRLAAKAFAAMAAGKAKDDAAAVRAGNAAIDTLERATATFAEAIQSRVLPGLRRMISALGEAKPEDFSPATSGNGHAARADRTTVTPRSILRDTKAARVAPAIETGDLPRSAQRLLDAAAKLESVNVDEPTRTQLAATAGVSATSSTTDGAYRILLERGLLKTSGVAKVCLTDAGRAAAEPVDTPPTLDEYHNEWRRLLGDGSERKLFDVYVNWPEAPGPIARLELAHMAGISSTSSTTDGAFRRLLELELLERAGVGDVKAGRTMFPEGLVNG